MADQSSEVLKSLEEEVRCPLCIDIFTDPKKLSCDHVVCRQCLQQLITRSTDGTLTCPECRTTTRLQITDANQFPTAHRVNRLIDIYKKNLEKKSQITANADSKVQTEVPMCSLHTSEPLALYCETCMKMVCRDCALITCAPKRHDYGFLKEKTKKYEVLINQTIVPLRKLQQNIEKALVAIEKDHKELERLKRKEMKEIDEAFDAFVNRLKLEKLRVCSKIEEKFEQQAFNNTSKTKELTGVLDELKSSVQLAESMTSEENITTSISKITRQEEKLQNLYHQFTTVSLQPSQSPGLKSKVKFMPKDEKKFFYREKNGFMYSFDEYSMLKSLQLKQPFKMDFLFSIGFKEIKLQSTFICLRDNSSTPVTITKLPPDMIRLSFVPQKRGRHELIIQAKNSATLSDCSFSSFVYFSPEQIPSLGKPTSVAIADASGIKCYGNYIYVTSVKTKVTVLERTKKAFNSCKEISLPGVNEIRVQTPHIYYTNISKHTLEKANIDGKLITSIGGYGVQPGTFKYPNGIRMSKNNEIYVCDSNNHRIQIFDAKLNLLRIIGELGDGPGQLRSPDDLVFDEDGNIYVVEQYNKRIQVFTPQGEHIRFIGTSGVHCLSIPVSPSIYNKHIFVTDQARKCVSVFTLTGKYVTSFGEKDNLLPECMDIDQDGYIFITSDRRNVIKY